MTKKLQNKQQGTNDSAVIKFMIPSLPDILSYYYGRGGRRTFGIACRKSYSISNDERLLHVIAMSMLSGFSFFGFAVRIVVVIIETLHLPRSFISLKHIFLIKTVSQIISSTGLYMEEPSGTFKI